jgi:tetratricopeptide (TPR) repeat protein
MSFHGNCPRCGTNIPQERYVSGMAVCECGWSDNTSARRYDLDVERKTIYGLIAGCLAIVAFYAHTVNWGSYALAIPFVKAQQITGTLSTPGYKELADVCITLNKWSCARNAYLDIYRKNGNVEGLADLGHFEVRMGEVAGATNAYAGYFKYGGKDGVAALEYAKVLEQSNDVDHAIEFYELSIAQRPTKLPIQATAGVVRLMMKKGQYEQAYLRIVEFHKSSENAKGFMNTELAQLEKQLSTQASGRALVKKNKVS